MVACAGKPATSFNFAPAVLKRKFLLFVGQKARSRLSEERPCHGARYCKGFHSPALRFPYYLTPFGAKAQAAEQKSGTITEEGKMADQTPKKPVVIILDMANGYGWKPGSFGYDMV